MMPIPIKSPAFKEYILSHGCFEAEKNGAIYEKWFRKSPRYLFKAVDERYGLTKKRLCDVGCSYGMNLVYCQDENSYGLELIPDCAAFAKSLGLRVFQRDLIKDPVDDLPRVEAVWCCAVLEHVDAPHVFLRKVWSLLEENGLIALYVPTIPPWWSRWLRHIPRLRPYFIAHTHSDHINAFTPQTIRFMCERAGFETQEVTALYPGPLRMFNHAFFALDGVMYIGKKKMKGAYFGNSTRQGKKEYFDA